MRILFVNTMYPSPLQPRIIGGAEVFSQRLVDALVRKGHQLRVLRSGPLRDQWPKEEVNGVSICTIPSINIYHPWKNRSGNRFARALWHFIDDRTVASQEIRNQLEEYKPDIIHTNNLSGIGTVIWKIAFKGKIPVVHTIHDYYLICPKAMRFRSGHSCASTCGECRMLTANRRSATDLVKKAVSVSRRTLDIHQENGLFKTPDVTVIPNACPTVKAPAVAVAAATGTQVTFGFIGRPTQEKGVFGLAEALGHMPSKLARLVIGGQVEDADKSRISTLARSTEVVYLGFVSPERFFKQVDVTVVPSQWEDPCPMVITESLAWGRPVLGAKIGGIPELLSYDISGWLFDHNNAQEMPALLMQIAKNPEEIDRRKAALLTISHRSFDDQVANYEDVYRSLIVA